VSAPAGRRLRRGRTVLLKTHRLCGDGVTPLFRAGWVCLGLPPRKNGGGGWTVRHPENPGVTAAYAPDEIGEPPGGSERRAWDTETGKETVA